jgi:hypothetical protein
VIVAHVGAWFKPVYDVAIAAIRHAPKKSNPPSEFNGYREFFRSASNYRLIETNVQGALRLASNFGNPVQNLPH